MNSDFRIAVIADGGFLLGPAKTKAGLDRENVRFAHSIHLWLTQTVPLGVADIVKKSVFLFRVYYYDCYPYKGTIVNPVTGYTKEARDTSRTYYLDELARQRNICLRAGKLVVAGWKIKNQQQKMCRGKVTDEDWEPNFLQKGVDTQITLDVSQLVNNRSVDGIVFITGDSDFAPLMEFVRRHGMLVYLYDLGKSLAKDLLEAADLILESEYDVNRSDPSGYSGQRVAVGATRFFPTGA